MRTVPNPFPHDFTQTARRIPRPLSSAMPGMGRLFDADGELGVQFIRLIWPVPALPQRPVKVILNVGRWTFQCMALDRA